MKIFESSVSDFGLQWAAWMFECFRYFEEANFFGFASLGKWFDDAMFRCLVRGEVNMAKVVSSPRPDIEHLQQMYDSLQMFVN